MHGLIRCAVAMTLGAGAIALNACTISDASEKKPAASAAANAAANAAPPTTVAGTQLGAAPRDTGMTANAAVAPPSDSTATSAGNSLPAAPAAGASTATPSGSAAPTTSSATPASGSATPTAGSAKPGAGALSPDSVDVGRTKRADLLPIAKLRLEVNLAARKLTLFDGDAPVATQNVAVGSPQWPTQTGEWYVTQVIWNPEWIPPDESWAEQKNPKKPGAPDNPLGRAQLVYDPPRTIHGTNEPASIGKPVSHGSIRLANAVIVQLARTLMEKTGAGKDDAWYGHVQQNRTEKVVVDLPQRVPIRVF